MAQRLGDMGIAGALHQPLGIDTTIFSPQRGVATLRQQLHLPPNARLLVFAGRFTAEKKLALLIEAARKLGPPYHLLLVGGGRAPRREAGMTILPFERDQRVLARLLASCDLLVHPGDCETFGLVVLEAMACGLPVVGTSGGGVAELIDHSCGMLVQPNSVASLCAGIEAVYARERPSMGECARRKVEALYDWERIMPQLMGRYEGLLAFGGQASTATEGSCVAE